MNETKTNSGISFDMKLYLIANGLSQCRNSYRCEKSERCYSHYMSIPPSEIGELWAYLEEGVKLDYLKKNMDTIFNFIKDSK
tara:strand:+ start:1299 stop:1544 length:246 start_codon:yes stop_codon:yes gene_type:complete